MIEVIDLTARRRGRVVLDEISFDIRPGQITGLLGAPGAGKTALVRQLVRLDRGQGKVLFDGRPYRALRHPSREVGLLLDPGIGDPGRTVRSQLRLLLAADRRAALASAPPPGPDGRRIRRRDRAGRRVDEVLDVIGLRDQSGLRLGELTEGMATRLALGAALLADPKALLLDDPGNGLEHEGLAWLGALLRAFTAQGRAALITGSDTDTMVATADRILLLDAGQLVGTRTAEEVLRAPVGAVVVVRSPQIVRFAGILAAAGARTAMGECACLEVRGLDRARVGDLAFRHGVPVHELAERPAGTDPADLVLAHCSRRDAAPQTGSVRLLSVPEQQYQAALAGRGGSPFEPEAEFAAQSEFATAAGMAAGRADSVPTLRPMPPSGLTAGPTNRPINEPFIDPLIEPVIEPESISEFEPVAPTGEADR